MQRAFPFRRPQHPRAEQKAHARAFIRFLVVDCRKAKEAHARDPSPHTLQTLEVARRLVRYAFKARH